jgi:hypothetical protein
MRIHISKQVYDLDPVECDCIVVGGEVDEDCPMCQGHGTIWAWTLGAEDSAAVRENLASQGVPLGKIGTN